MQAELHTSINTVDVVNRFQKLESKEGEDLCSNHGGNTVTKAERKATSTPLQPICDQETHKTRVRLSFTHTHTHMYTQCVLHPRKYGFFHLQ